MIHRLCKTLVLALPLWCTLGTTHAQEAAFPTHSVRINSPFPTGSGPDTVARILAEKLQGYWNQSVVVDARPGANGVLAIDATRRAPADGYELVIVDNGHATINPSLFSKLPYNMDRDFAPVALIYRVPFYVTVANGSAIKSVKDLIAQAKAKPGTVTYGIPFVGSPAHLGNALFESMSGTKMVSVPFKETSQLFASVSNGDVDWALGTVATTGPFVRGGKLKLLAVAANERSSTTPDVPTVDEVSGLRGYEVNAWVGLLAPKATPPAVLDRLNRDFNKALNDPGVREKMLAIGAEPAAGSRSDFAQTIKDDTKKYSQLVKSSGIKVE